MSSRLQLDVRNLSLGIQPLQKCRQSSSTTFFEFILLRQTDRQTKAKTLVRCD